MKTYSMFEGEQKQKKDKKTIKKGGKVIKLNNIPTKANRWLTDEEREAIIGKGEYYCGVIYCDIDDRRSIRINSSGCVEKMCYYPDNGRDWDYRIVFKPTRKGLNFRLDRKRGCGFFVEVGAHIPDVVLSKYSINKIIDPGARCDGCKNYGEYLLEVYNKEKKYCRKLSLTTF